MGDFSSSFDIGNIIDQSGLSDVYTSGVTDFDTYVATDPTHTGNIVNSHWFSSNGTLTGNIDFDLGSSLTVSRIALWFRAGAQNAPAITNFTLFADDENTFTAATNLGSFTNAAFTDLSVQVYDFTDTQAQFIRMQITANNGNIFNTAHGEVAFDTVSAVPVPAAVWLMGSALVGLLGFRKKAA